jgi:hypothetical protein
VTRVDVRVSLRSEIYQVTGPVERFAGQIASQGYVVGEPAPNRSPSTTQAYYVYQLARLASTSLSLPIPSHTTPKVSPSVSLHA